MAELEVKKGLVFCPYKKQWREIGLCQGWRKILHETCSDAYYERQKGQPCPHFQGLSAEFGKGVKVEYGKEV